MIWWFRFWIIPECLFPVRWIRVTQALRTRLETKGILSMLRNVLHTLSRGSNNLNVGMLAMLVSMVVTLGPFASMLQLLAYSKVRAARELVSQFYSHVKASNPSEKTQVCKNKQMTRWQDNVV